MKIIKNIGLALFLSGITIFISTVFIGDFKLTDAVIKEALTEQEYLNLNERFSTELVGKTYTTSFAFSRAVLKIFNEVNDQLKADEQWDKVIWTKPAQFAFKLSKASSTGYLFNHKGLFLFLTFGMGIIGSLLFILPNVILLGPPGIKNNGVFTSPATNRGGWIGMVAFAFLFTFYILLYFFPFVIVNWVLIVTPVKHLFNPQESASQWFLYGLMYSTSMTVMAIRMFIKYRGNNYQIVRTISVVFFQIVFAFLLVEILPLFGMPGKDLKNAWPLDYYFLFDWNVKSIIESDHLGKFVFVWGIALSVIVVPVMVYFYGKRWYCSWVCGCGGLAETLGDPYRQLSSKKLYAWKLEWAILYPVLGFIVITTIWAGYHTYNVFNYLEMDNKEILLGISASHIRDWYGFLIGSIFAGVIGTGFYPVLGNRSWCRFGCPLAAYLGIVQRLKSRFRITTNGGQCISCGNCSTYCEQGIDVRAYAQKGQNIVRASCVGCGVCSAVCPRGVLKLENAPDVNRVDDNPILIGKEEITIKS